MPTLAIRHFTDPTCPFAFSAEPQRHRLRWLYGEEIEWDTHMVVLSETPPEQFTPQAEAASRRRLSERYGMPMALHERPRLSPSVHACRAFVQARLHDPEHAEALLRRLRVLHFAGEPLDDPAVLARAAAEAGIADDLPGDGVEEALRADMAAARAPAPAALALDHKLGGPEEERRYTLPSYEIARDGDVRAVPGYQPLATYEAAIANVAPDLERRADPASVSEVLAWAPEPLATVEVAAVCALDPEDARAELARSGARFEPLGTDGYWSPASSAATS